MSAIVAAFVFAAESPEHADRAHARGARRLHIDAAVAHEPGAGTGAAQLIGDVQRGFRGGFPWKVIGMSQHTVEFPCGQELGDTFLSEGVGLVGANGQWHGSGGETVEQPGNSRVRF